MKYAAPMGIALAALGLVAGYAVSALWAFVLMIVALGLLWLVGLRRGWDWMASFGLVSFIGLAAFGIWLDLPPGWMLFGAVATLVAWDLDCLSQRVRRAGCVEGPLQLGRAHLRRLMSVSGLGLLLGWVALGFKLQLSFGWAFLLGLLAVLGLSQTISFLRRESQ